VPIKLTNVGGRGEEHCDWLQALLTTSGNWQTCWHE